jgi:hypothetical protein
MRTYGELEIQLHAFLTKELEVVNGELRALAALPPEKYSR